MSRRTYKLDIDVNLRRFEKAVIDPHYEQKHGKSINDKIILELVKMLHKEVHIPQDIDEDGYQYFVRDGLALGNKKYRLIWLTHPKENYIGIINAYRR